MRIKGNVLLSRLAYISGRVGDEGLESVLAALPESDQAILRGYVLGTGWYPFELGDRLDRAIVQTVGNDDPRVFEDIGAASAQKNLSTIHKMFLQKGDPQAFLLRAPSIYKFYYDTGKREYQPTGPQSGILTTYDAEICSTFDCLTVIGWYEQALAMCGANGITIAERACRARGDQFCQYAVSWTGVTPNSSSHSGTRTGKTAIG